MQSAYENNIIITESSKNLRALGRNALTNNWKVAMVAVLVYTLIVEVVPALLNDFFGMKFSEIFSNAYGSYGMDASLYSTLYGTVPDYSPLSGIYLILVSGPLQLGMALFFLAMFRRQLVEVSDIFLGFEKFGKTIGLFVYQAVFIFLWSLLFIIPGIIAAMRYSQAYYILADDPEKSIKQCMDESKFLMKGNKFKYFLLMLSFIGWSFLASLIGGVLAGFAGVLGIEGMIGVAINIISGLFMIPVIVYIQSTRAGFYEILAGHLIKSTEPAPISPEEVAAVTDTPVEEIKKIMPEPVATAAETPIAPVLEVPQKPEVPEVEQAKAPVLEVPEKPEVPEVEKASEPILKVAEAMGEVELDPEEKKSTFNIAEAFEEEAKANEAPDVFNVKK